MSSVLASSDVLAPPTKLPSQASSQAPSKPSHWKRLSVGQFFGRVNWEQTPLASQGSALAEVGTSVVSVQALSYRLSVSQFFGAIPWQGAQAAAAAPVGGQTSPASDLGSGLREAIPAELPDLDAFADSAANADAELTLDDIFGSFADF